MPWHDSRRPADLSPSACPGVIRWNIGAGAFSIKNRQGLTQNDYMKSPESAPLAVLFLIGGEGGVDVFLELRQIIGVVDAAE